MNLADYKPSKERLIATNWCRISLHRTFIRQAKKEIKSYKKNICLQEEFIKCYKEKIKELKEEIKKLEES